MDYRRSILEIVWQMGDMGTEDGVYVREVYWKIKSIRDVLKSEARAFEPLDSTDKRTIGRRGRETFELAIQCKKAVKSYILMRRRQQRRGLYEWLAFCLRDRFDRIASAKNLSLLAKILQQRESALAMDRATKMEVDGKPLYDSDDEIVGREKDIISIRKKVMALDDDGGDSLHVLYILGPRGIGKSTVARNVFRDNVVRDYFDCFAWIGEGSEIKTMTEELLNLFWSQLTDGRVQNDVTSFDTVDDFDVGGHGSTATGDNIDILKRQLYDFLKDKRYLIVIDNFKMTEAWNEFIFASRAPGSPMNPHGLDGSRIMLITEVIEAVLHAYPCYKLNPLSDEESWELFVTLVRPDKLLLPPEFISIGRQLVRNCYGVPVNIVNLANRLSEVDAAYNVWYDILNNSIRKTIVSSSVQELETSLLTLNLQSCLSYFELFPRNYIIRARRLIALWVAEGLVKESEYDLSYMGMDYLHQLVDKGFITVTKSEIDGRPKACSLARYNGDDTAAYDQPSTMMYSATGRICRLLVQRTEDLQPSPENQYLESYKFLTSFTCIDYRKSFKPSTQISGFLRRGIDKNYFLSMKVLDLEGASVYHHGRLLCLKTLSLVKLRTIDVKHTYINSFPIWICKLQNLQHLYMSENHRGKFVYRAGSLLNIESSWGIFIDDESDLEEKIYELDNIKKLGLSFSMRSFEGIDRWITRLDRLESLKLRTTDRNDSIHLITFHINRQLSKIYMIGRLDIRQGTVFPVHLKKLTLSASMFDEDPMEVLGCNLPYLTILRLYADSYVGLHMICRSRMFRQLKVLKLWKLEQLENWIVEEESMPILEDLEIRSCKRLNMLPVELQQITTLKELKLTDMSEEFEEHVKHNNGWSQKEYLRFTDWNVSNTSTTGVIAAPCTPSSSSGIAASGASSKSVSSSLASLVLLHLLAKQGVAKRTTTVPKGLPTL